MTYLYKFCAKPWLLIQSLLRVFPTEERRAREPMPQHSPIWYPVPTTQDTKRKVRRGKPSSRQLDACQVHYRRLYR